MAVLRTPALEATAAIRYRNMALVVGLSGNVVAPEFTGGRLDGIGTYTLALESELRALGVDVRRVLAPKWSGSRFIVPGDASLRFAMPQPISIAINLMAGARGVGARDVERAVDIYHATDYMAPPLARRPVVATLFDAISLRNPEWASPHWRSLKNMLMRGASQTADRVIAISHAAAVEVIEHFGVRPERVRVVPLGVDSSLFSPRAPAAVSSTLGRLGLRHGYFLFVGTLQPRKNVIGLLQAYASLPESIRRTRQLVIAGKVGWRAEELREQLLRGRADNRCVWLDYVAPGDLPPLYAGARALVLPSLAEGFGLPILEALAVGVPVIASDLPALRESGGRVTTYVPAGDPAALSEAMRAMHELVETSGAAHERREHARGFSWRACAERTLAVYRELA